MDYNEKKMLEEYFTREHAFRLINSKKEMLNYLKKFLNEYFEIDKKIIDFYEGEEEMTLTILDNKVILKHPPFIYALEISYKIDGQEPEIIGQIIVNNRDGFHELKPFNSDKSEKFTVKHLEEIMEKAFSKI